VAHAKLASPGSSEPTFAERPLDTLPSDKGLQIDGISKRYGDVLALDGLTLEVAAGEVFGFVGRNGAGKTTTMRIVLGVLDADEGAVRFAGNPLTFETRRRIGYMPEERGLYPQDASRRAADIPR